MGMQPNKANLFSAYLSRVRWMKDESDFFYIMSFAIKLVPAPKNPKSTSRLGVLMVIAHALHVCR